MLIWPFKSNRSIIKFTIPSLCVSLVLAIVYLSEPTMADSWFSRLFWQTGPKISGLSPVVFAPGFGGSRLWAKLDKTSAVRSLCKLKSDGYLIWISLTQFTPLTFDCLCENMMLVYNETTGKTQNTPGVHIEPYNFGSLDSVESLDRLGVVHYFHNIAKSLVKNYSYDPNLNLVAAPYDFRKAPNELVEFFHKYPKLIEDAYENNGQIPVTIICHSMGCLHTLTVLNHKSQEWKDKHVRRMISLAAPWSGSFKAIATILYGDDLDLSIILQRKKLHQVQQTYPGILYLFPRGPVFDENKVIVTTAKNNYTLATLDGLLQEANYPNQMKIWHEIREIANNMTAPNVELWCLYGRGKKTPVSVVFDGPPSVDTKFHESYGDGDGTVNIESLEACKNFVQDKPVHSMIFDGLDHIATLRDTKVTNYITDTIFAQDEHTNSFNGNDLDVYYVISSIE